MPPNTQGIGAKITLRNGAVPVQTREMIAGGRFLSGSEARVVFATGSTHTGMSLEVRWRNGTTTRIDDVRPNRLYEIDEPKVEPQGLAAESHARTADRERSKEHVDTSIDHRPPTTDHRPPTTPVFKDQTSVLTHTHHENLFDDFARQPLLPRKLSQLGSGVCWFDLNGDGHEDLVIGAGRGGEMAIFLGNGSGGFTPIKNPPQPPLTRDQAGIVAFRSATGPTTILVGSSNYEDGLTAGPSVRQFEGTGSPSPFDFPGEESSIGPLALADLNGAGELELFVGGRVIPGRYPEPARSRLFRMSGKGWQEDRENSMVLAKVGLVSGAVWSDLDGNGFPELILACEWGPVRIYRNSSGHLREATDDYHLSGLTGWWTGVTTGDLDGDGRLDIVASNWGLNSPYQADAKHPVALYYGDLLQRGSIDIVESEFDVARSALVPRNRLDILAASLPFLRERYTSYKSFSEASVTEILGDLQPRATILQATTLSTTAFLNRGDHFEPVPLPREAQFAPTFGVCIADFNGDGNEDVFLAQNFFPVQPQMHRLDAGRGLLLLGDGTGKLRSVPGQESGVEVYGDQRGAAVADFNEDGKPDLVVTQNGEATRLFENVGARPGLRVRLQGPPGNPDGIGAVLRVCFGDRRGPAREIHAGSGYWSQDSMVQVLGTPEAATAVWVRWPGGRVSTTALSANAREVKIEYPSK
jgi:hypothetical protein